MHFEIVLRHYMAELDLTMPMTTVRALIHVVRQGSFVSSGNTRLLSLRRSTMEAKLGPLQKVIDQADDRVAKGEALKEKNKGLVSSLKVGSSCPD